MITVRDIIEKNEDMRVIIELKPNRSDTEPLSTELYDGMLHDVPEELRELEVLRTGWLIGAGCHCVDVIKD